MYQPKPTRGFVFWQGVLSKIYDDDLSVELKVSDPNTGEIEWIRIPFDEIYKVQIQ